MEIWLILVLLLVYGVFEFINSIFFNWRLMLLSEKKFTIAGIFAGISTLLLVSSVLVASWVATDGTEIIWWLIPFVGISMGIGNFLAAMLVPKIRAKLEKARIQKKENK